MEKLFKRNEFSRVFDSSQKHHVSALISISLSENKIKRGNKNLNKYKTTLIRIQITFPKPTTQIEFSTGIVQMFFFHLIETKLKAENFCIVKFCTI